MDPKKLGKTAGIVAFLLCFAGGVLTIPWQDIFNQATDTETDLNIDGFSVGLGLYFIGKACFVGPMLYMTGKMAALVDTDA